jgi:O-antigen ligase
MLSTGAHSGRKAIPTHLQARQLWYPLRLLSDQVIFSCLVLVIGLAAVPFGSVEPWWEGIFESPILMLGACFIVTSMVDKQWQTENLLSPLIGLIIFAGLQTLPLWHISNSEFLSGDAETISIDPFSTKRFAIKLLVLTLTLFMLLRYASSRRRLLWLARMVIIVGAASAAFAIWRSVSPGAALAFLGNNKLQGDSFGQFMNRNHFAVLMEMSLGVALGLAFSTGLEFKRYLYTVVAFGLCVALIMANSRGGIISLLGQVGFLAWIGLSRRSDQSAEHDAREQRTRRQSFWLRSRLLALRCLLILILLGAALSSVLLLGGEPVRHRLESVPGEFLVRTENSEHRNARRLEIWGATLRLIEAHPVLGSGFGAYKMAISKYFQPVSDWQPQQAHNEYLELAAAGGVVGTLLAIWFVFNLIRDVRNCLQKTDAFRRAVCVGALVGLVGVAIHSLVDFGLHVFANALVCCALIALATAKTQPLQVASRSAVI